LLLGNLETAPGHRVSAHLGIVQGSTARAQHAGKDILAGLKNIVGGELEACTDRMQEARAESVSRRVAQAQAIGANAVLNGRFVTTRITAGAAGIPAYGCAVTIQPL
jgi:uncharacterized protein YbjQ (UPF0145 family)